MFPFGDGLAYVMSELQEAGSNWDPVHQRRPPEAPAPSTTRLALRTALGGRMKSGGPSVANRAVVTTSVNRIEMAVLMATI